MDSSHLVDPELYAFLQSFPPVEFSAATLHHVREVMDAAFPVVAIPDDVPVTRSVRFAPGPGGAPDVRLVIYAPKLAEGPLPAYYFVHGGGYVQGAPDASVVPLHDLAHMLQCVVVAVDYRLAPESPHPGPVEDCHAGLQWVFDHAAELGIDPERIGIGGESAGGGLAAALALLARDRGAVRVAFQHLRCPMLDDRTCVSADPHPFTGQFLWTPANNAFGWQSLLGVPPGSKDVSPYAAPARAESLAGLPPTFIAVGALDLFLEEDLEYARRLTRAGVPVELHVYPGAFHGFEANRTARLVAIAERDSNAALARALRPGTV